MAKKSLLSGSDFDSIGRGKGGGGGRGGGGKGSLNSNDKIKVGVAAGLLVVAGLLMAWQFGLLPTRGPAYEPPPPEVIQAWEEEQAEIERQVELGIIEAPAGE